LKIWDNGKSDSILQIGYFEQFNEPFQKRFSDSIKLNTLLM